MGVATMSTDNATPLVTICPPHRRSKDIARREPFVGGPPITTATALQWPVAASSVPTSKDDRRPAQERLEAAQRAEAVSVALAQPHRAGSRDADDKALESPLGRFCLNAWPKRISDAGYDLNAEHRAKMREAGMRYGEIVHQHRVLLGLGIGARTSAEGFAVELTDAQLRANCEAARMRRDDAEAVLRAVSAVAISAMVRLCVDELEPTPYREDLSRHCLWALAVHFGIVKMGRFGS